MRRSLLAAASFLAASACASAPSAGPVSTAAAAAGEGEFRALFKELVEINTTLSVGSCIKASEAMKARLLAAGWPESDLHTLVPSPVVRRTAISSPFCRARIRRRKPSS